MEADPSRLADRRHGAGVTPTATEEAERTELVATLAETGDPLFVVDRHCRIVGWNRAAQALFCLPPRKALGRPCFEVLEGTDLHGRRICVQPCRPMLDLASHRSPASFPLVVTGAAGRVPVEISLLPLPGGLVAHLVRDTRRIARLESFAVDVERALDRLRGRPETSDDVEPPVSMPPRLTAREREILHLLAQGEGTAAIASHLVLTQPTVRKHIQHILSKLGAHHRLEAVATAARLGLLG